jgi:hypothetical protein
MAKAKLPVRCPSRATSPVTDLSGAPHVPKTEPRTHDVKGSIGNINLPEPEFNHHGND